MSPQWFLLWCVLKLIFLELMQEEHAIRHIGTRTVRTNVNIPNYVGTIVCNIKSGCMSEDNTKSDKKVEGNGQFFEETHFGK